jgi:hypothetical protein
MSVVVTTPGTHFQTIFQKSTVVTEVAIDQVTESHVALY